MTRQSCLGNERTRRNESKIEAKSRQSVVVVGRVTRFVWWLTGCSMDHTSTSPRLCMAQRMYSESEDHSTDEMRSLHW